MPSERAGSFSGQLWPRVIGQHRVKGILLSALRARRLPHAYLFYGSDGVGKDAMALELARVLHCETNGEEACGTCSSCVRLQSMQHPDVKFVVALPVGKSEESDDPPLARLVEADLRVVQEQLLLKGRNPYHRVAIPRANVIKINSIREVRRHATMSAFSGRKKIVIISHAEEMGEPAANTLLKTLEEPSGDTLIILTTPQREALLPTIISRCQPVRFDTLTEDEICSALVAREGVPEEKAALVARLANGSYVRALELLADDVAGQRSAVVGFIRLALSANAVALVNQVDALSEGGDRDRVLNVLTLMLVWFRDALVLSRGGSIINVDQVEDLQRFVGRFPAADLVQVIAEVDRAISLVNKNVYIRLVLLQLCVALRKHILTPALHEA